MSTYGTRSTLSGTKNDVNLSFTPVPTVARLFGATPDQKFLFLFGPVGSTKTTTCLHFILMSAARQEPSPDGIRRTRYGIIRNTLASLKQTILKDTLSLFGQIAQWNGSENTLRIRVADIDTEWMFMPLEHAEDQRRLLSLQLSGLFINEVREIDFLLMMAAFSRTGRYPSERHGGVKTTHRFLLADSNMGVNGSRLYQFLEEEAHPEVLYIHQPSALSPTADWLQYLPKGYYEDAQIGQTKAWVDTHVHALWSHDLTGLPIFADLFNPMFHVSSKPLTPMPGYPLLVGCDPGFNPAALICQLTPRGQLRVYREIYAPNCLFGMFIDQYVVPVASMPGFALKPLHFICDPAAVNRNSITGMSAYGLLQERKIMVDVASTNDIDPRLKGIERLLTETRGPEANFDGSGQVPALLIDPSCAVLIRALSGEYRFKKRKLTGELEDKPEKKHPISDVADALGYVALGLGTSRIARDAGPIGLRRSNSDIVSKQKPLPAKAWT